MNDVKRLSLNLDLGVLLYFLKQSREGKNLLTLQHGVISSIRLYTPEGILTVILPEHNADM